jgi:thioredoxin reductase (NADPH)
MLDCLVIGAGPAGLTAALYLRRFERAVRIVSLPDSRALKIDCSRNVPGFPEGISGQALLQRLRQQLAAFGGEVQEAEVRQLQREGDGFVADCGGEPVAARRVLLATGVQDVEPVLPGVEALWREQRLRHCPICDGHEHRGHRIAVLGRGDHGAREALFLRRFSDRVVLFEQHPDEPASPQRQEQLSDQGIQRVGSAVTAAQMEGDDLKLTLGNGAIHAADVVYVALGCRPRSALAAGVGAALDAVGNVVTDDHLRTTVPGLYAAGDIVSALDQIAVAHGHAAISATAIHNSLP